MPSRTTLFASVEDETSTKKNAIPENETMEEEVERMVAEAREKAARMAKMKSASGQSYAPWMNMSDDDLALIRATAREKAAARRQRQVEEQSVTGSLLRDSTNQELSGTGVKGKIVNDGAAVELEWATGSETNTKGFIVKRRTVKTPDFIPLNSYETFGPLSSQGPDGGVYRYLDETVTPGEGYVFRITECDLEGVENDLSQCLIEIPTESEQRVQTIALAAFALVAAGVVGASLFLDPMQ
jgi:hypothetical protein